MWRSTLWAAAVSSEVGSRSARRRKLKVKRCDSGESGENGRLGCDVLTGGLESSPECRKNSPLSPLRCASVSASSETRDTKSDEGLSERVVLLGDALLRPSLVPEREEPGRDVHGTKSSADKSLRDGQLVDQTRLGVASPGATKRGGPNRRASSNCVLDDRC